MSFRISQRILYTVLLILLMAVIGCQSGLSLIALNKQIVQLCCDAGPTPVGTVQISDVGRSTSGGLFSAETAPLAQWEVEFDSAQISIEPMSGRGDGEIEITALDCPIDADIEVTIRNLNAANFSTLTVQLRRACGEEGEM